MHTVSLARGGWASLSGTVPQALQDFKSLHSSKVNLETVWPPFKTPCWWTSDSGLWEELTRKGLIVLSSFELAKLTYRWTDWVEYHVFTHKVFSPNCVFDLGEYNQVIVRSPDFEGVQTLTDQLTWGLLRKVRDNINDPKKRFWTTARWLWWVSCLESQRSWMAEHGEKIKKLNPAHERSVQEYLGSAGRCPYCNGDQWITDRGFECHAGHCLSYAHVPF